MDHDPQLILMMFVVEISDSRYHRYTGGMYFPVSPLSTCVYSGPVPVPPVMLGCCGPQDQQVLQITFQAWQQAPA